MVQTPITLKWKWLPGLLRGTVLIIQRGKHFVKQKFNIFAEVFIFIHK